MNYDKNLFFDAWMTYLVTNPVFTLIIGDPVTGKVGVLKTIL